VRTVTPVPPRTRRARGYIEELASGNFRAIVYAGADPLTGTERRLKETTRTVALDERTVALRRRRSRWA
jgi:hypothetical protein